MPIQQAPDSIYAGTKLSNAEKMRLVAFYKKAFEDIANALDNHVWSSPSNPRLLALLSEVKGILLALDSKAARWAEEHVLGLYRSNVRWVDGTLIANGVSKSAVRKAALNAKIHRDTIEAILRNPTIGITPRLVEASRQVGKSIESFVAENKLLLRQSKMLSSEVAQNILRGTGSQEARNAILKTLMSQGALPKSGGFMGLNPFLSSARALIEAPFLSIPLIGGGSRRMHIFDHVQMTAFTMEARVRTEARSAQMAQHGIRLAQISPNPPLTECVCALYAGRIVSLDPETERKTGYPWIGRLPGGGPPFHPYCRHTVIPWVPDFVDAEEIEQAHAIGGPQAPTFGGKGIPVGALNSNFSDAMRYFKKRGGIKFAARQNRSMKAFGAHRLADPVVKEAVGLAQ